MPNPYFRFKQFTVYHDKCAMKVGTDGVLLGAWADTENCNMILDVGSGSGLISLMLAQRSHALIDSVEIDKNAYLQSLENINNSEWKNRITVHYSSFADFCTQTNKKYNLIVSNPPYFSNSLLPPDKKRQLARHDNTLPLADLLSGCACLLNDSGKMAFILPISAESDLDNIIVDKNLFILRKTKVKPTTTSAPKRLLIEIGNKKSGFCEDELIIETGRHIYSEDFKLLTKDFYLAI